MSRGIFHIKVLTEPFRMSPADFSFPHKKKGKKFSEALAQAQNVGSVSKRDKIKESAEPWVAVLGSVCVFGNTLIGFRMRGTVSPIAAAMKNS